MNKLHLKQLALAALVLGVSVLSAGVVPSGSAQAYSTSEIESKLRLGVQSAVNWDNCRNLMAGHKGNLREKINGVCSYANETWLSGKGAPNASAPISVKYDQTTVGLQINSVKFLAGSLIQDDLGNPSVDTLVNSSNRWVKNKNDAVEKKPNAIGTSGMKPALVSTYKKIVKVEIIAGGGTLSSDLAGNTFETRRDNNTRYWFANAIGFDYNNSNIEDGQEVQIKLTYKQADSYYKPTGKYDIFCTDLHDTGDWSKYVYSKTPYNFSGIIDKCGNKESTLSIVFKKEGDWDVSGVAEVKDDNEDGVDKGYANGTITVQPGDAATFRYTLTNNGPTPLTKNVYSNEHSRLSANVNSLPKPDEYEGGVTMNGAWILTGVAKGQARQFETVRNTTQNDVGKTICRRVQWSPIDIEGNTDGRSNEACVKIPYDYSLEPNTPSGIPDTAESTMVISSVTASIDWTGPTKSKTAYWQLTMFTDNGANLDPHNSGTAPCGDSSTPNYYGNEYGSIGSSCTNLGRGTDVIDDDNTSLTASNVNIGELEVGTRVCFVMSVRDRADDDTQWAHSAAKCLVISKKPKVQVLGGDLWVGSGASTGKVSTSITTRSGNIYGSYTEYGLVASGQVSGMASGSAYVGGSTTSNLCNGLSRLTLNNVNTEGVCSPADSVGRYTKTSSATALVDAMKSRFSTTTDTPTLSGAVSLSSKESGIYKAGAAVQLGATTIGKGQWYVINAPTSTVVIEGDLQYTGDTLSSAADIPQVIIIANAIYIRDNVSRVDAWLVASNATTTGLINTCDVAGESRTSTTWINSTVCSTALTVNGPVVADQLLLRRTAGTGKDEATAGDPAEVFNFRPDAYLWLSGHFSDSSQPGTGYTRELPAKY